MFRNNAKSCSSLFSLMDEHTRDGVYGTATKPFCGIYICSKTLFVNLRIFVDVKSVCVYVHLWKSHSHSAHLRFACLGGTHIFRSYFSTQNSVTIDDVCLKVQPPKPYFCLDQSISPPDHLFILASQASQPVLFKGQIPKPCSSFF